MRVEERYKRVDAETLELVVTVTDPELYTEPWRSDGKRFRANTAKAKRWDEQIHCVPAEEMTSGPRRHGQRDRLSGASFEARASRRENSRLADLLAAKPVEPAEARLDLLTRFEHADRKARRGVCLEAHYDERVHDDYVAVGDDVEHLPRRVRYRG